MMRLLLALAILLFSLAAQSAGTKFPAAFDSLGPTVHQLTMSDGREVHYIDDGEPGWTPVVFTGGLGTSVRVIRLLDFLRSFREQLRIRVITVERNGFGQTAFNPELDMSDFVAEVGAVLDHLKIDQFAVFGISGGGPYSAKIASAYPERLLSVHMAATSLALGNPSRCGNDSPGSMYESMLSQPMAFFGFDPSSPMHQVEGFQDTAFDEAARAHFIRGQMADTAPLLHELSLYCTEAKADLTRIDAPVYVYYGLADSLLGDFDSNLWRGAFPNARVTLRTYPGEGHDVQYRHLDQILLDIARRDESVLICENRRNRQRDASAAAKKLARGATMGLCAWDKDATSR